MVFPETEGYSNMEVNVYYSQHVIASILGTLVLSLSGRFDMLAYHRMSYYLLGFIMFTFYIRLVLTPIALLTWANLNHTLCGTDTDPVWLLLGLGKWYYIFSELYLGAAAFLFCALNFAICYVVKRVVLRDETCSHETFWTVKQDANTVGKVQKKDY